MAGVVILGLTNEEGLWVVDLEAGAVLPLEVVPEGDMARAASYRNVGATFIKGVDFAVHVTTAAQAAEGLHEGRRASCKSGAGGAAAITRGYHHGYWHFLRGSSSRAART